MTKTLRACALILSLGVCLSAADVAKDVEAVERGFAQAATKADISALERYLASDLVYTHSSGGRDTRESYIKKIQSGELKYEKWDYSTIEVHSLTKDVAFLTARAAVRVSSGGKQNDMNLSLLHVFILRQGRWQLVAHQSARLP